MFTRTTLLCFVVGIFGFHATCAQKIALEKCKEFGKLYERKSDLFPNEFDKIACNSRSFPEQDQLAKFGEFPYMATLKYKSAEGRDSFHCSGVLISENYLLTAAYCAVSPLGAPVTARFGYMNLTDNNLGQYGQEVNIINLKPHPDYSSRKQTDVIALVKLETAVKFNKYVHPICLPSVDVNAGDAMGSGWNFVFSSKYYDNPDNLIYKKQLVKRMFKIYGQDECKEFYKQHPFVITNEQMCAGPDKEKCDKVEPNGIILVKNEEVDCMDTLVGINNYGPVPCKLIPDVYTKISPYVKWIESIVWD